MIRLKITIMVCVVLLAITDLVRHGLGPGRPHIQQTTVQKPPDASQGNVPTTPTTPITFPVTPKEIP